MTTQDHDTDPSTPGAKRLPDPRVPVADSVEEADPAPDDTTSTLDDVAALAADMADPDLLAAGAVHTSSRPPGPGQTSKPSRPTTDPGIAPPPEPLPVPARPMGIVVPPAGTKETHVVDVLLEGMSRDPFERRTTAHTDGQRAAKYHAKHAIHAPRESGNEEPKVVIARQALARTVRVAAPRVPPTDAWAETTAVHSQPMAGRVFIAVLAGLIVVTVIFVALRRTAGDPPEASPNASEPARTAIPVAAPATVQRVVLVPLPSDQPEPPVASAASAEPSPSASSMAPANGMNRKTAPVWQAAKVKAKPTTGKAADDLGEFKSAF